MVREIVSIQVGQCGNQIGNAFWEEICLEHDVDTGDGTFTPSQSPSDDDQRNGGNIKLEKLSVYFEETSKKRFVPRSVLVDLEPGVLDLLKSSPIGKLFKPDNFIFAASGGANNWAKTHYNDGPELIDEICDVIRQCMEGCDCPQGVQLSQSLGGGTGSGLGSLILLKLREHYPDRVISSFSVFPSTKVSDVVVEPYNATLTIPILLEDCDQCNVIDNEALFDISSNILHQEEPKYSDLNWVISLVMSGCTASLRFPGQLNGDLRKMGVNLVPFPRLHFFTVAAAPLLNASNREHTDLSIKELLDQLWSGKNYLSKVNLMDGRYLSTSCVYRGSRLKTWEVENEQRALHDKLMDQFVNWIPNNIMTSVVQVPSPHSNINASMIANFTGINAVFRRISRAFHKMFKKKAFYHHYLKVGMHEDELRDANRDVKDLIAELQAKNDAVVDEDNPYDFDADDDDEQVIGDSTDDEKEEDYYDSDGVIQDDESDTGF